MELKFLGNRVRSFNVELTNRCFLGCSACARHHLPHMKKKNIDLPLEVIKKFFPLEHKEYFQGVKLNICGSFGDCIYHPEFQEIIRYLADYGFFIYFETNASHKDKNWWEETAKIMGHRNWVNFSVDGLSDTNSIYRKGAKWSDIEAGMRACVAHTNVRWKYIVFSHNEHQIEEAIDFARELGVHQIRFQKSHRFTGGADPLLPKDPKWQSTQHQNKMILKSLRERGEINGQTVVIKPRCLRGKNLAITSDGNFYPCPSVYSSFVSPGNHIKFNGISLRENTVLDALNSPVFKQLQSTWDDPTCAPEACSRTCGVARELVSEMEQYASVGDKLKLKPYEDLVIDLCPPYSDFH